MTHQMWAGAAALGIFANLGYLVWQRWLSSDDPESIGMTVLITIMLLLCCAAPVLNALIAICAWGLFFLFLIRSASLMAKKRRR